MCCFLQEKLFGAPVCNLCGREILQWFDWRGWLCVQFDDLRIKDIVCPIGEVGGWDGLGPGFSGACQTRLSGQHLCLVLEKSPLLAQLQTWATQLHPYVWASHRHFQLAPEDAGRASFSGATWKKDMYIFFYIIFAVTKGCWPWVSKMSTTSSSLYNDWTNMAAEENVFAWHLSVVSIVSWLLQI